MPGVLCEGPRCGGTLGEQGRAEAGLRLCAACRSGLGLDLDSLPKLYRQCESLLVTPITRDRPRIHAGGPRGIALDDGLVGVRAAALDTLAAWAGLVVRERPLSDPPARQVEKLAGCLSRHLLWLAGHHSAKDAATEIAAVTASARRALDTNRPKVVTLGLCRYAGCGRPVTAALAPALVSCEAGHRWQPHQWLWLARQLDPARSS